MPTAKLRETMATLKIYNHFGDSLFLQPLARYYLGLGLKVRVATDFPLIFQRIIDSGLPLETVPWNTANVNTVHYAERRHLQHTSQWEDIHLSVHLPFGTIPYKLVHAWHDSWIAPTGGRQICVIGHPYFPLRHKSNDLDLMPDYTVNQAIIHEYQDRVFFVQVGSSDRSPQFRYDGIALDLSQPNFTDTALLFNVVQQADLVLCQIGHLLHLAEGLDKPAMVLFSHKGLKKSVKRERHTGGMSVRYFTPKKIIWKPTTRWCQDHTPEVALKIFGDLLATVAS